MKNKFLLLNKKHTDTKNEQTKSSSQGKLQFTHIKKMETFSFKTPIKLFEEEKRLLTVTSFEATNSVFNKSDENKRFQLLYQVVGTPNLPKKLLTN